MPVKVAPCDQLQPHGEHIYEWSRHGTYLLCPGHEDDRRYKPKKRWWRRKKGTDS